MSTANTELNIWVKLRDDASKSIEGLNRSLKQMEPTFQKLATAGAVGFTAITGAVALSVRAASQAETSQARLAQILRTATDATDEQIASLIDQADALERVGVVSGDAIQAAQGTLATFDLQSDSIKKLIPSFLNMVVAERGVNATTEDMIGLANGLGKVLQGQVGALSKQGFIFDEATEAMLKNGTEQEKVIALAQILDSTYSGLNERMRQTTEGGIVGLTNAFGKLQEEIGRAFLPVVNDMLAKIQPIIIQATEWASKNPELTRTIVGVGLAVTGLAVTLGTLGLAFTAISAGLAPFVALLAPIPLAIAAVAGALIYLYTHSETLREGINNLASSIGEFFVGLSQSEFLKSILADLYSTIQIVASFISSTLMPALSQWWGVVQENLLPALQNLFASLSFLKPLLEVIGKIIGATLIVALNLLINAIAGVIIVITQVLTWITQLSTYLIDFFGPAIVKVTEWIKSFTNVFKELYEWINKALDKLADFLSKAKDGIGSKFKLPSFFKADGGAVNAGSAYTVGERGPETFIPATNGTIIPNGAGGGATFNVNIDNFIGDRAFAMKVGQELLNVYKLSNQVG